MRLTLFSTNLKLVEAWKNEFKKILTLSNEITILDSDLVELESHDILVTAGNSFGIMDGGIDLAVRNLLGYEIQRRVQKEITFHYGGIQPVGSALLVDTNNDHFPILMYLPTMVFPGPVGPPNVFYSFRAALTKANLYFKNMGIDDGSIACCGLASLTGKVPVDIVAREMLRAYQSHTQIRFNDWQDTTNHFEKLE